MSRGVVLALAFGLGLAGPALGQVVSPRAFTQEFADALRAREPGLSVTVTGELDLQVKDAAGKQATLHLGNAYAIYKNDPKARAAVIERYARALLDSRPASEAPIDRARIVPVVKDDAWLKEARRAMLARGGAETPQHVVEQLAPGLIVIYAEDSPGQVRYLTEKDIAGLGLKKEALRALAVNNLHALLPKVELLPGELISMFRADGNYEASLLLFDDIWSSGTLRVNGEAVVAVPARDLLLVTGSKNRAGVARLREVAAKLAREASYGISDRLFVYRGGRFQRFEE
jgi:uncharacterized protein YtpQ (UPF0354 family)